MARPARILGSTLASAACLTALSLAAPALAVDVTTVPFTSADGTLLKGVLYTPDDYNAAVPHQHAVVVMLHGCSGMWSNRDPSAKNSNGTPNLQNQIEKWGLELAAEGYVALAVDSYTPREPAGISGDLNKRKEWQNQCSGAKYAGAVDPYTTRVGDARAAYDYLIADTARIDSLRVGLLGWSQGAETAMVEAADSTRDTALPLRDTSTLRFATTVVFYPGCGAALGFGDPSTGFWRPYADFRMNVGDLDSFYANCEARVSNAVALYDGLTAPEIDFAGYDGAAHSFDGGSQSWPTATCGGTSPTGDTCAMYDADINSLLFFDTYL